MDKFIIIDASAVLHRAWHALPKLKNFKGQTINAVYGFTSLILRILYKDKPDYLAVAFDTKAPTFRHKKYKEYKANRVSQPPEFYKQIPWAKLVLESFNLKSFSQNGLEADDLIGALNNTKKEISNLNARIITGDLDLLQLIDTRTEVYFLQQGLNQNKIYNSPEVLERFGVSPKQIIDLKALVGDPSDNISGLMKVGPKTASQLIQEFGNIEGIYQYLEKPSSRQSKNLIRESLVENLVKNKKKVLLNKTLVTILDKAPGINVPVIQSCRVLKTDMEKVLNVFEKLGFKSLTKRLITLAGEKKQTKLF